MRRFIMLAGLPAYLLGFFLAVIFLPSCSDPAFVGEELVDEDVIDILQSDTFDLRMRTLEGDSLLVYDPPAILPSIMMAGRINDDIFGDTRMSFYMQFRTIGTTVEFNDPVVDSVFLILEYDSTRFYGIDNTLHDLEVFRVVETMDAGASFDQSQTFGTNMDPLGGLYDFDPDPTQLVTLIDFSGDTPDTTTSVPHARIPLSDDLGRELLLYDSLQLANDTIFWELFQGLYIATTNSIGPGEMMAFKTSNNNSQVNSESISRLSVYYHENAGPDSVIHGEFRAVLFGSVGVQNIEKDYSGSLASQFVGQGDGTDSLLFVEGLNGLEVEVDIPDLSTLGDVLVNKAELEFVVAEDPGYDDTDFPPLPFLRADLVMEDGTVILTDEFNEANAVNRPDLFGGFLETDDTDTLHSKRYYIFNLSQTVQKIIDGTAPRTIRLTAQPKRNNPYRTVLYGFGNTSNAVNLKITYTIN